MSLFGRILFLFAAILFSSPATFAQSSADTAPALAAFQIMQKTDGLTHPRTLYQNMTMILDNGKEQRTRKFEQWLWEDARGEKRKSLGIFNYPNNIAGTGVLTVEDKDESDQWLYLPSLKKSKKIAASEKSGSFMGSDYYYEDMERNPITSFIYIRRPDATYRDRPVFVIESRYKNKSKAETSAYGYTLHYIDRDEFLPRHIEYFNPKGKRIKRLEFHDYTRVSNLWVWQKAIMIDLDAKHKTVLMAHGIKVNFRLDPSTININRLENPR